MDALLEELAAEQKDRPPERSARHDRFVPDKKGSYVSPEEENITTNMFVGNLAPTITEYVSPISIMWPRTPAESNRNRNTGGGSHMPNNTQATHVLDPNEIPLQPYTQPNKQDLPRSIRFTAKSNSHLIDNPDAVDHDPEIRSGNAGHIGLPRKGDRTVARDRTNVLGGGEHPSDEERRRYPIRENEYMTGRQIERARGGRRKGDRKGMSEGKAVMTEQEIREFDYLVRKKLNVSREAVCAAMAFCFEKSASAQDISNRLKECLVDEAPLLSVDLRIARLYLLSDILFNSQQPGVKNAFMYRDAIEKMAGEVFGSLGRSDTRAGSIGRMTMNKLRMAVKSVLGAWTEWSVYNPSFLDELEARFDGREIVEEKAVAGKELKASKVEDDEIPAKPVEKIIKTPQGDWTEVIETDSDANRKPINDKSLKNPQNGNNLLPTTKTINEQSTGRNGDQGDTVGATASLCQEDMDGSTIEGNTADQKIIDKSPLENTVHDEDIDGEAIEDSDLDGSPLEDGDVNGDGQTLDGGILELDLEVVEEKTANSAENKESDIDGEDLDGEEVSRDDFL
eukprot:scaffold1062_cov130-Cylindrotheca_fusiformis.AAC.2